MSLAEAFFNGIQLILARCDSYNTVQLQLLSGSEAEARSPHVLDPPRPGDLAAISRSSSRGRSRTSNNVRQSNTSAPPSALVLTRDILEGTTWPIPRLRQAHSARPNVTHLTPPTSPSSGNDDPDDSMDTDEEEVDFWGGESPRSRLNSSLDGQEMAIDGSSEDDDDDSEDDEMSDGDDEDDEYNRMDIFGHR